MNFKYSGKERLLKPQQTKNGYYHVVLCKNRKKKTILLHRLVAEAFIPNLNNLPQVNHIDENKENNSVANLEFCTSFYNQNYGTHQKRASENKKKTLLQYDKQGNLIKEWKSASDAEKETNGKYRAKNIRQCCTGEKKSHQNFIWKYKE